jgi:hypothetical protein
MALLNYPRLAAPVAMSILREWHGLTPPDVAVKSADWQPPTSWYEIGPRLRTDDGRLRDLADDLRGIAADHGYPDYRKDQLGYECETGVRLLHEPMADVGADGVWTYLAVALVPDVVMWRWGWPQSDHGDPSTLTARKLERFLGGFRNNFRRARQRVAQFGAGPDDPPRAFWEDALVSVEERPSLGADPRVAALIFHAARPLIEHGSYLERQNAFRAVAREIRQTAGLRLLSAMSDEAVYRIAVGAMANYASEASPPSLARLDTADDQPPARRAGAWSPGSDAPDDVEVVLRAGAVNNSYLSVRPAKDWLPVDSPIRVHFIGTGDMVTTSVAPATFNLRIRSEVRRFYDFHDLAEGDRVLIRRQGRHWLQVEPVR